jgi:hypothetical protein
MIKTNKDRANKIARLLGLRGNDNETEYYRVADVLSDLQHYCRLKGIDYIEEIRMSDSYQSWETENE